MPTLTSLLWPDQSRPKRGPKPRMTLEEIVDGAIALADTDGLEAVTMQRLAEGLAATKMALYRYVPGKAELTALMLDAALGLPPETTADSPGWRALLASWATDVHERFGAHPWTLELAVGARVMGPNELSWLEAGLSHLSSTPLPAAERLDVLALLSGHVRGIIQQGRATPDPERETTSLMGSVLAAHAESFPSTAAAFTAAAASPGQDDAFSFGLERILDGVAAHIDRRAGT